MGGRLSAGTCRQAARAGLVAGLFLAAAAVAQNFRVEGPLDGLIEVAIPTDFRVMSDAERMTKYLPKTAPQIVFTNKGGNFDVAITRNPGDLSALPIDALRARMSRSVHTKQPFATWHGDEVVEINGREFARLEFTTRAFDTSIRNILLETPADGALLRVSINMPEAKVGEWMPIAARILESVHITKP
jgi:hypothetical protein